MDQNKTISIRCEGQEYHDIEDLIPFQGKLKSISSDNFHKLKESIKSDGIPLGFHIWKQKEKTFIMDGHHRKMALQALKDEGYFIPPVPCNLVIAKSKKEAAKIVLISNSKYSRVSEESLSDYMIDMELKVEDLENLDIPELNMDDFEPEQESKDGLTDDDSVPEVEQNIHGVVLGDIYQLGNHRLMCGDSTSIDAVEKLMDGQKADMVFTDPPYGISIVGGGKAFGSVGGGKLVKANSYAPVIGDETTDTARDAYNLCVGLEIPVMIFWGGNHYSSNLPSSSCWIVWDKDNTGNFADAELAWTNQKTAVRIFKHTWNGLIKGSERGEKRCHPTQKPIALAEWCFEKYGENSKSVIDLFGGSGSTLIACEKTNRKCFMMELDPHYCSVIIERWQQFTGLKAVKHDAQKRNKTDGVG